MTEGWTGCRNTDTLHLSCLLALPLSLLAGITFRLITFSSQHWRSSWIEPNGPSAPELWIVQLHTRSDILHALSHTHTRLQSLLLQLACYRGHRMSYGIHDKTEICCFRSVEMCSLWLLRSLFNDRGTQWDKLMHTCACGSSFNWRHISHRLNLICFFGFCFILSDTDFKSGILKSNPL